MKKKKNEQKNDMNLNRSKEEVNHRESDYSFERIIRKLKEINQILWIKEAISNQSPGCPEEMTIVKRIILIEYAENYYINKDLKYLN